MNDKEFALFKNKDECCGCGACRFICQFKAIHMTMDEEGFEYPVIDDNKCTLCQRCVMVCPLKGEGLVK